MARMIMSRRPTVFRFYAPEAKDVSLAGNFNNWSTRRLSAKRDSKGNWTVKVNLKPGRYEYKFFVDGSWFNDPHCTNCTANTFGTQNCVVDIK